MSIKDRVLQLKKRIGMQGKVPKTPMINALIGMTFMKMLIGGYVNNENNYLLEWGNFGPEGTLSLGD